MSRSVRWLGAVAAGVIVFEGVDACAARIPATAWLTLASPCLAGAAAAWAAGGGAVSRVLAAAATAWVRIGTDRIIGLAHGVRRPLEMEAAVAVVFGLPWMVMAIAGGILVLLARRAIAPGTVLHARRR